MLSLLKSILIRAFCLNFVHIVNRSPHNTMISGIFQKISSTENRSNHTKTNAEQRMKFIYMGLPSVRDVDLLRKVFSFFLIFVNYVFVINGKFG